MAIPRSAIDKINDYLFEIPKKLRPDMCVPARIYASENLLSEILSDRSLEQLVNMTTFPGIKKYALAMPDAHEGFGFPIGGVAAISLHDGVISPGGIGYDINCGVRLLISSITYSEIKSNLNNLAQGLFENIPAGVGRGGLIKLNKKEFEQVLNKGVDWLENQGFTEKNDRGKIESGGFLKEADSTFVYPHAKERGKDQLGTMGAGNHFVEIGRVGEIFDEKIAKSWGIFPEQITILIHTGSRGLGHQVATDYIRKMLKVMPDYKIYVPDRELACAPFSSKEGKAYFKAMSAAANFAWANRSMITWQIRKVWQEVLGEKSGPLSILYDVAHNIAKIEEYEIDGKKEKLVVHRKGATRAFPNQPVIIPGSMGTSSYVLVGKEESLRQSFGSTCHGAGRRMSRHMAKQKMSGRELWQRLKTEDIKIYSENIRDLSEEAPFAYKDIDEVVEVVHQANICQKVAKLKPLVVIKG